MSLPEQESWELSMLIPMAAHASDHSCDHMARFLPEVDRRENFSCLVHKELCPTSWH